jgi:pimeloyl-ACP methyl ester carboxylesterase
LTFIRGKKECSTSLPTAQLHKIPIVAPEEKWLQYGGQRYCSRRWNHPRPEFEPTLFLSGAFQTMESWRRFASVFARFTTVILVDPPGLGRSDGLPPEFGVDFLAESMRRLLDAHAIDRINIIAASYGTPAAFRLAQLCPGRIARIALGGTMRKIPLHVRDKVQETVETALKGDRQRLAQQVIDGLLCRDPRLAVQRRRVAERVLRSGLTRMSDAELRQYAWNTSRLLQHAPLDVSQPLRGPRALLFTGEHDCFTAPAHCMEMAAGFESAWVTTVLQADHLFHIEQFEVVSALLLRFMRETQLDSAVGCGAVTRTDYKNATAE